MAVSGKSTVGVHIAISTDNLHTTLTVNLHDRDSVATVALDINCGTSSQATLMMANRLVALALFEQGCAKASGRGMQDVTIQTTFNAHSQVPVRACTQRLVECLIAKPLPDEDACAACQHVRCRFKRSLCAVTNACIASYRLPRETKLQLRAFVCIYICVCTCTHRRAHGRVCLHTCMRVGDGFRLVGEVLLRRKAASIVVCVFDGTGQRATRVLCT